MVYLVECSLSQSGWCNCPIEILKNIKAGVCSEEGVCFFEFAIFPHINIMCPVSSPNQILCFRFIVRHISSLTG